MKKSYLNTSIEMSSKLGRDIIKEALTEQRDNHKKKVVNEVTQLLERVSLLSRLIDKSERRRELCQNQLTAINEGKFSIDESHHSQPRIIFSDESLNVSWDETERW